MPGPLTWDPTRPGGVFADDGRGADDVPVTQDRATLEILNSDGSFSGIAPPNRASVANQSYPITRWGAKCDAVRTFGGGAMSSGSPVFSAAGASFKATDVGKLFYVAGAGAGAKLLATTILQFNSATSVTLAAAASTPVSGAHYAYGTDDTQAWADAMSAIGNGAICTITVPFGLSLTDGVALRNNTSIRGAQADGWAFRNLQRASGILLKPLSARPAALYGSTSSVGNAQFERLYLDGMAIFQGNTVVRYSGATTTAGSNAVVFTNGSFGASDVGKKIAIYGAGPGGSLQDAAYVGFIATVADANNITVDDANHPACFAVSGARYAYGFADQSGTDGATSAASNVFNAASASFTAADVGKVIEIYECMLPLWGDGTINNGDGFGEQLVTHITAVNSPTQAVLHTTADLATTGKRWRIGAQAGIYQPHSATSQDSMWHVDKCVVANFAGNGYNCGLYQRAQRFSSVYFWQMLGHGMWVRSSDNSFALCMWAQCGEDGMQILQSSNHFLGGDIFSNDGNGSFIGGYGGQSHFVSVMYDNNARNGALDFGVGTKRIACRFTSNGIAKNAAYADVNVCSRLATGVTRVNTRGVSNIGCYHVLSTPTGNKPAYGIFSIGPFGISGTGVEYDSATSPFTIGPVSAGYNTIVHQHSFAIEGGNTVFFRSNNVLSFDTSTGTKIGGGSTEKLAFWGATPVVKPAVSGSKASGAALASLLAQLAAIGLITDSTSS